MARTRLDLPSAFLFSTDIDVRISDVNYGGHLGNDAVLALLHEARMRFLNSMGYSEKDIEGAAIIMTDAVIVYKAEGFYGDPLTIDVAVVDLQAGTCDFVYRVRNRTSGIEIARAKTGIAFFDYEHRRVVPAPDEFANRIRRTQGS